MASESASAEEQPGHGPGRFLIPVVRMHLFLESAVLSGHWTNSLGGPSMPWPQG